MPSSPRVTRIFLISLLIAFNIAAACLVYVFISVASLGGLLCEAMGGDPGACTWKAIVLNSKEDIALIAVFLIVLVTINAIITRLLLAAMRKSSGVIRT
jgi:hypothetical protein